jgi:hypothetical protein
LYMCMWASKVALTVDMRIFNRKIEAKIW